ncbi:golgin subfamily A member 4-like [Leptidea sinapis]|uniref:golgin subfamily A member 4-like n=1 Tax=Leptidea sinapis TaxID=189913 RepID=UPI00212FE025|nr:golgin subfamily A member 4-like [Leptidea sinapis]XP_050679530.1 golgin subfamily A member 4-like [Leptidea sinapis]
MLPNRYVSGQSSSSRKSRYDGKPSMLPKPSDGRRPSNTGRSSSSQDPNRGTFGGRLSRDTSGSKTSLNRRSRSHTAEGRYTVAAPIYMSTPRNTSRITTTPVRTPGQEVRNWTLCLERAQACVTIKDQRPISNLAWQRSECARVSEALTARGGSGTIIRPLTIARFVEIVSSLLNTFQLDGNKLNNDTYVAKLPHLLKRILYPGVVSASWLRTVNTLHAFPQALALIAYLIDLVAYVESPVCEDSLYTKKDDVSLLRRDYLYKCWLRFQDSDCQFDDLYQEYQQNVKNLFGDVDGSYSKLQTVIIGLEAQVEDGQAIQADEQRTAKKCDALVAQLRGVRTTRRQLATEREQLADLQQRLADGLQALAADHERARAELSELTERVERQSMSVTQRNEMLDEVSFAVRVYDTNQALWQQVSKMVQDKDNEIAQLQKRALDSCMQYNQALIYVASKYQHLADLVVDEKQLRSGECVGPVGAALERLAAERARLAERGDSALRARNAQRRSRAKMLEEHRAKLAELKLSIDREQQAVDNELTKETAENEEWRLEEAELRQNIQELESKQELYRNADEELSFWKKQKNKSESMAREMGEYVAEQRAEAQAGVAAARGERERRVRAALGAWSDQLRMD